MTFQLIQIRKARYLNIDLHGSVFRVATTSKAILLVA